MPGASAPFPVRRISSSPPHFSLLKGETVFRRIYKFSGEALGEGMGQERGPEVDGFNHMDTT